MSACARRATEQPLEMKATDKDRIYFLMKDPHWTFIWWEISERTLEASSARGAKRILRVYDVTDIIFDGRNSHHFFDTEVTGETDHWYLYVPTSNRNYCVEFGISWDGGEFHSLVRSNTLSLPRDTLSECTDESWSTIVID
jgi:hypothetical protein